MRQTRTTTHIAAPPGVVFTRLTDLDRLPDWNAAIRDVPLRPARLEPGAEWTVTMHVRGMTWRSRAHALEVDRERGRFAYRSSREGTDPSCTLWRWAVDDGPAGGSTVTVTWQFLPETPLYRILLFPMRRAGLAREVQASLGKLAAARSLPANGQR